MDQQYKKIKYELRANSRQKDGFLVCKQTIESDQQEIIGQDNEIIYFIGDTFDKILEIQANWILVRHSFNMILLHKGKEISKLNLLNKMKDYDFDFLPLPGYDVKELPIIVARSN